MSELTLRVLSEDDGLPVRRLALQRLHMSCGQFKRAKFEGELLLDGMPVHANEQARAGQLLVVRMPRQSGPLCTPYALPLQVPYEDEDLLVVDKPAPLAAVGSCRQAGDTLENAVYSYLGCPSDFLYQPVNRLDKGTSGLMVVAKHSHAQQYLQGQLHTDRFVREYLAVCDGAPPEDEGLIDLPIAKEDAATIRRVIAPDGKPARTRYWVLERHEGRSLLRLRLDTGRTHQIRVHLQALGCPVTGDFLYGVETPLLPRRFALHSERLEVETLHHGRISLTSPLPPELERLLHSV